MSYRTSIATILVLLLAGVICAQEKEKWSDRIELGGDFRYRHETTNLQGDPTHRQRQRVRARFGATAKIDEGWKVTLRLGSGEIANSVSGNQTLGDSATGQDALTRKFIWLESAYFEWKASPNMTLLGGKFPFPLTMSDLTLSPELSFEGGALKFEHSFAEKSTLFGTVGQTWLRENAKGYDQSLLVSQIGWRGNAGPFQCTVAAAYNDYANVKQKLIMLGGSKNNPYGNTTDTIRTSSTAYYIGYHNDYNIVQVYARADWLTAWQFPLGVFGEYAKNTEPTDENTAWFAALQVGKAKNPRQWEVIYSYRVIERDATVGAFAEPSFGNGGTNTEGHKVSIGYMCAKNVLLNLHYFENKIDPKNAKVDFKRLQVDLGFKF